jgi:hypothetical protein
MSTSTYHSITCRTGIREKAAYVTSLTRLIDGVSKGYTNYLQNGERNVLYRGERQPEDFFPSFRTLPFNI